MPRILISAGEPSGDLHGAAVARALRERWPDADLYGLGGDRMAAEGVRLLAHTDQLAVMGFAEVATRLPYFLRLFRTVKASLETDQPALVIPIDYPGFNMKLAKAAKALDIPVLYYIAPQVWAWHRSRIHDLAAAADRLAVILPFEEQEFREAGANVSFVGHPLLDREVPVEPRETWLRDRDLDPDRPVLALFPGSRAQEVHRHATLFADAAREVRAARPDIQPVIGVGSAAPRHVLERTGLPLVDDGWTLLHHARAALLKSGTGTLEAALAGVPPVIAYRMHPLTYMLAKRLVRVDHVGLVNLVAGDRVAPEFIQEEATPARLAAALLPLLENGEARRHAMEGIARVRDALALDGGTAAGRVADLAAGLVPAR